MYVLVGLCSLNVVNIQVCVISVGKKSKVMIMRRESVRGHRMDQQYGNVESLFETRSVSEIEEIVKKLEKEIESKRSDLRQVVG